MISLKNVTKTFGKIKAVEDATFSVGKGEFVFITGPSGAGKTTLLRLILRDYLPDKGQIFFEGKDIVKLPSKLIPSLRQKIGMVFQDFKVLPERTVKENVEVALAVKGLPTKDWESRVRDVLNLVGLIERAELFPSQLSGGELQRVSLARALVVNPKVILADEPTGNLDWDTADELMELLEGINKEGKTVVMATHHQLIVKKHSLSPDSGKLRRKVIKIDKGRIVDGETPKEESTTKKKETEEKKIKVKVEEVKGKK